MILRFSVRSTFYSNREYGGPMNRKANFLLTESGCKV